MSQKQQERRSAISTMVDPKFLSALVPVIIAAASMFVTLDRTIQRLDTTQKYQGEQIVHLHEHYQRVEVLFQDVPEFVRRVREHIEEYESRRSEWRQNATISEKALDRTMNNDEEIDALERRLHELESHVYRGGN